MNASETFVQINDTNNSFQDDAFAMLGSFTSIGGAFEFWTIGSANGAKQNHKYLTEITGRPPMPPISSLGFHYSKYEENSADLMIARNEEFTAKGFPVDVFWSDLYYTEQFEYFVFNYETWPIDKVEELNRAIGLSKRRLVMINDPHIKVSEDYFVYSEGMAIQNGPQDPNNVKNIFILNPDAKTPFVAKCWPGYSQWIDYLNSNAADFWGSLYARNKFVGSNYLYGTWNDMNEPSVFKDSLEIDQLGMPMNNTHITEKGQVVEHRWVHNAYGALM